jgi:hydrogenase maturation protease
MSAVLGDAAVLGVGNVLLGDDGVGPRVVGELRRLARRDAGALPIGTRLVDAGTLGVDALAEVAGAGSVVVVDAVDLGLAPGSVVVLRGAGVAEAAAHPGVADDGVGGLLAMGRLAGWLPDEVSLVGVQVARTTPGTRLSDEVEAAVAGAVMAVCDELASERTSA